MAKAKGLPKTRPQFLAGACSQWRCPPSSDSAPALELVEDAREAAVSLAKVEGPSESAGLESLRVKGEITNDVSPAPTSGLIQVAPPKARLYPAPPANANELVIKQCDVSARKERRARHTPWSETLWAVPSQRRRLSLRGPVSAVELSMTARESSRMAVTALAKAKGPPKTRTKLLAGAHSQWRYSPSSDSAIALEPVENAGEAARSSANVEGASKSAGPESLHAGGVIKNAKRACHVLDEDSVNESHQARGRRSASRADSDASRTIDKLKGVSKY
ncbi:hypothetical protein EV122DRAFT_285379 [Schizophyllum commune]